MTARKSNRAPKTLDLNSTIDAAVAKVSEAVESGYVESNCALAAVLEQLTEMGPELPDLPAEKSEAQRAIEERMALRGLSFPVHGEAVELQSTTPEQGMAKIAEAMDILASVFVCEYEKPQVFTDGETGEETRELVVKNRLGFEQGRVVGSVIMSMQSALNWLDDERNDYGIPVAERSLRQALYRADKGTDVDAQINSINAWLERLDDKKALLSAYIEHAKKEYFSIIGRAYREPGQRAQATREVRKAPVVDISTAVAKARARLAKRG